jgi:hypothetical protein
MDKHRIDKVLASRVAEKNVSDVDENKDAATNPSR